MEMQEISATAHYNTINQSSVTVRITIAGGSRLKLDQYLAKNTSEDNASFSEILEETQKKHRDKHSWLFDNEKSRTEVLFRTKKNAFF